MMDKNLRWRAILIAVVIVFSALYISPSFVGEIPEEWKGILPSEKVHFGLDLQGGVFLRLTVEIDKAIEKNAPVTDKEIQAAYETHSQMLVRDGKKVPLPEVKEQLRAFLQNEKRRKLFEDYLAAQKGKAKIVVNDAVLAKA
jgi:preprotein translocase subunit SecD